MEEKAQGKKRETKCRDKDNTLASIQATQDTTYHDDHVAQMRLDCGRLLERRGSLLGGTQLLDELSGLALEAAVEAPAGTRVDELKELW